MQRPLYQIDAFTDVVFHGNPAAVCPLDNWLTRDHMLSIARENNLAETAFFVKTDDHFEIRWFTPEIEMDLCGHATLASAHVIFSYLQPELQTIHFESKSGPLHVTRNNGMLTLDSPSRPPEKAKAPSVIIEAMNTLPMQVLKARDYILVYPNEETVVNMTPDIALLEHHKHRPRRRDHYRARQDCRFRFTFLYTPGIDLRRSGNRPAHCSLIPYWAARLRKNVLHARQVSQRGGDLLCELQGERTDQR